MKALVLQEYHQLVYTEVALPRVGPEEVLVQVKACGICGSDVHGLDGSTGRRIPPLIMGHEASGVVAELGENVADWQVGERVTFDSTISCGACFFCRRGQINLCDERRILGVSCEDYRRDGAFAEYVVVPQHILYRLPEGVSFEQATMVEALSVAVHAVRRTPIALNDTAVVVGTGMIGLLVLQALRAAGCGQIMAVDLDPERLALARQLGASETMNPEAENVVARVRERTENRGADVAFEVVGLSPTLKLAVGCLRKGGALALVGNLSSAAELPLQAAVTRELTLYGSCASQGEYPASLDLIARGVVDVEALISSVAPLAEGAAWFERLYAKEPGLLKVILKP